MIRVSKETGRRLYLFFFVAVCQLSSLQLVMGDSACLGCSHSCSKHPIDVHATPNGGISFYKIISESTKCSNWMQVPVSFVRKFGGFSKGCVTLEGPSGQEWKVDMSSVRDDAVGFSRGWKEFSTAHNLKKGDLLVFSMISESQFLVKLFDKTGCEKTAEYLAKNSSSSCTADGDQGNKRTRLQAHLTEELTPSKKIFKLFEAKAGEMSLKTVKIEVPTPETEEDKNHSQHQLKFKVKPEVEMEDPTPESKEGSKGSKGQLKSTVKHEIGTEEDINMSRQSVSIFRDPKCKTPIHNAFWLPRGTRTLDKRNFGPNGNKISASKTISNVKGDNNKTLDDKRHHQQPTSDVLSINTQTKFIAEYFISQRRPVTKLEEARTLKKAEAFKSSNPFALLVMKKSHVYRGFWLGLPVQFSRTWLPSGNANITLTDSDGKDWQANWLGSPDRCSLGISGGWRGFALNHGLEEGDVCIFELTNRVQIVLKVHIFHVVEPIYGSNGSHNHKRIPQRRLSGEIGNDCDPKRKTKRESNKRAVAYCSKTPNKNCIKANKMSKGKGITNGKEKQLMSEIQKLTTIEKASGDSQKPIPDATVETFKVERLLGRRTLKASKETDFLVLLENTKEIQEIMNFEREKEGVWWVPFSHFTEDFLSCHS